MRTFETSNSLDIAQRYVDAQLSNTANAWPGLFSWCKGDSDRLQAILHRKPPLTDLAEYLKTHTPIKPTMALKIIDYGKSPLLDEFVHIIKTKIDENHFNPTWLFARFPCASSPTVRRTLVKYTSEALASHNGELLMLKSLYAYNADWISEITLNTPRTIEQTQQAVVEIARELNKPINSWRGYPIARKNLTKIIAQLSVEEKNNLFDYAQKIGVDVALAIEEKEKVVSTVQAPVEKQPKPIPKLDLWNVQRVLNKNRLTDEDVIAIIHNSAPTLKDRNNRTLLERVVLQGLTTSFDQAVKAGGNLQITDHRGENLAHKAGQSKRKAMLKMVMEAGVNPWSPDQHGRTTLHNIVLSSPNMIDMLMKHPSANPNAVDKQGATALFHLFTYMSDWNKKVVALKSVNTLLEYGVDPNIRDQAGQTFLDMARSRSNNANSRALLEVLEETVARFQNYKVALALDEVVGEVSSTPTRKKM